LRNIRILAEFVHVLDRMPQPQPQVNPVTFHYIDIGNQKPLPGSRIAVHPIKNRDKIPPIA
jgi:hypothetical protein